MHSCFKETLKLTLSTLIAVLVSQACGAQSYEPTQVDAASIWKTEKLASLDRLLAAKGRAGIDREELEARRAWLKRWTAGELAADPSSKAQLPKTRQEPVLDSELATRIRKQLNWKSTDQDESDLATLTRALAESPDDLGLQQLQLHWLDLPFRRKAYLKEINSAAQRLIQRLDCQNASDDTIVLAKEFAMYRRGRALAYRELPDVVQKTPIADPQQLNRDIGSAYRDLIAMAGQGRPEFILMEVRVLRRQGSFGKSLGLVEQYGTVIKRKWYLKKRRDLLKELGWEYPFREAAKIYASEFPEEVAKEKQDGQRP